MKVIDKPASWRGKFLKHQIKSGLKTNKNFDDANVEEVAIELGKECPFNILYNNGIESLEKNRHIY